MKIEAGRDVFSHKNSCSLSGDSENYTGRKKCQPFILGKDKMTG